MEQHKEIFDVRGGSGLGDAIYINGIMRELLKKYHNRKIVLRTKYPGVFKYLPIETKSFTKGGEHLAFNYGGGARKRQTTNLYQDLLLACGFDSSLPMETTWKWYQSELCDDVLKNARGRKICLLSSPHVPFGRDDGRGDRMIINWGKLNSVLHYLKDKKYYIVQIGKKPLLYNYKQVDHDLTDQTTVSDLLNLGMKADIGIGQCGFIIPLMKGYSKPYFIMLSQKGLDFKEDWFIACLTLEKLFCHKQCDCGGAVDSWDDQKILEKFKHDCRL